MEEGGQVERKGCVNCSDGVDGQMGGGGNEENGIIGKHLDGDDGEKNGGRETKKVVA